MSEHPLKLIYLFLMTVLVSGCSSAQESMYDAAISAERMVSGMNEASITIHGQKTAYLERPGDGEIILLIHGFGADKDNWTRFVRYLPRQYRVIAFDLPGHGGSSRDDVKTYTIDFITEGFAEAADALDLKRFHLAGNSMGGWVSMLYTERNPERVITLGLFDTAGTASPEPSDLQAALTRGDNILVPETQEAFLTLMDYGFFNKPFIPWPMKSVLARRAVEDAPFKKKMWNDINLDRRDVAPVLPDLNLPTLILWGADDRIIHVSAVRTYERYLPRSETVIMKDCGHIPMLERPKETANYYVNFLDKHKVQAVP